jgi:hypothetical protein
MKLKALLIAAVLVVPSLGVGLGVAASAPPAGATALYCGNVSANVGPYRGVVYADTWCYTQGTVWHVTATCLQTQSRAGFWQTLACDTNDTPTDEVAAAYCIRGSFNYRDLAYINGSWRQIALTYITC